MGDYCSTYGVDRLRVAEYQADKDSVSDEKLLLTIDFAQNISLPHAAETPSQWYVMSLIGVAIFGVHSANDQWQTNFLYTERRGDKGSNEVISMVDWFLQPMTTKYRKLTVFTDNCGGQNKNNFVLKYFLLLTHAGYLEKVHYKFFVRGHTKISCDRGFGMLKKKLARNDCWSLEQLSNILNAASIDTDTELLDTYGANFIDIKGAIGELYRNLPAIQKYQIFSMYQSKPGVVECRQTPLSEPDVFDIRPPNPEKIQDIYKNIRPYVPEEYRNSSLYTPPSSAQPEAAQDIKRARITHRAGEKERQKSAPAAAGLQATAIAVKAVELQDARDCKRKKTTRKNDTDEE